MSSCQFCFCPPVKFTGSKRDLLQLVPNPSGGTMAEHQGVLYKRRDIFTRQWRPRWFHLQSQTGILTYYLFSSNEPPAIVVGSTPLRPLASEHHNESVQYDVVPRGTIYLRGCQVQVADEWSRPSDNVYCFVVTAPNSNAAPCYLATTSAEDRDAWIAQIRRVCDDQGNDGEEQETAVDNEVEAESTGGCPGQENLSPNSPYCWSDAEPEVATAGLRPGMKAKIDAVLDKYLPYTDDGPEWSILFENKDGVTAYQREGCMIKSVAILDHHPKQIFGLVADIKRRREYEKNVRYDERVKRYNSHTFIDYYAYQPVWPTAAREFLVLFHWRVVRRQEHEKAIVLIGFSYPDGNSLRPSADDHVRADLEVSLFHLELCDGNKTKATRIISYDLCGKIPRSLTNSIMQQQATMPYVISSFLKANEPIPHSRLCGGDITNTILAEEIIDRLPDDADGLDCVRRRLLYDSVVSTVDDEEPAAIQAHAEEKELPVEEDEDISQPSVILVALILMTPLVVYNLIDGPLKEVAFLVSAFIAVRVVVLFNLGTPLIEHDYTGVISCRLSVNLRGFLHFLAKRRQDNATADGQEPSVIPLVLKAVGKALAETDGVNCKHTCIPILGVSGCFLRQDVAVSVLCSGSSTKEQLVTIPGVANMAIESIALEIEKGSEHSKRESSVFLMKAMHAVLNSLGINQQESLGSCLVVTCPDSEGYEIDLGVVPSSKFNAVVVVGGVRMSKLPWPKSMVTPAHRMKPPPPLLAVTISVRSPACSIAECRRFAERVQEHIEQVDL